MIKSNLVSMTPAELVERFVEIGIAQADALEEFDTGRFNRLFDAMRAVSDELKHREPDGRQALVALLGHPNAQVRIKAAKHTLAIAPDAARQALEELSASGRQPQALEAGMSLWNLQEGVFRPE